MTTTPCYLGFGTLRACPNQCKGTCSFKPPATTGKQRSQEELDDIRAQTAALLRTED